MCSMFSYNNLFDLMMVQLSPACFILTVKNYLTGQYPRIYISDVISWKLSNQKYDLLKLQSRTQFNGTSVLSVSPRPSSPWVCRCTTPTGSQASPTTASHSMVTVHTSAYQPLRWLCRTRPLLVSAQNIYSWTRITEPARRKVIPFHLLLKIFLTRHYFRYQTSDPHHDSPEYCSAQYCAWYWGLEYQDSTDYDTQYSTTLQYSGELSSSQVVPSSYQVWLCFV